MNHPQPRGPYDCKTGDTIDAALVQGWPRMTETAMKKLKRITALRTSTSQYLVREGKHVFLITQGHAVARCVYCHERQF